MGVWIDNSFCSPSKYGENQYAWPKNQPSSAKRSRTRIKLMFYFKSIFSPSQLTYTDEFKMILTEIKFSTKRSI